jgi:hypothetical protein
MIEIIIVCRKERSRGRSRARFQSRLEMIDLTILLATRNGANVLKLKIEAHVGRSQIGL